MIVARVSGLGMIPASGAGGREFGSLLPSFSSATLLVNDLNDKHLLVFTVVGSWTACPSG